MSYKINKTSSNPLIQMFKNLLSRFFQAPDVYPIKYYKKNKRFRKNLNFL